MFLRNLVYMMSKQNRAVQRCILVALLMLYWFAHTRAAYAQPALAVQVATPAGQWMTQADGMQFTWQVAEADPTLVTAAHVAATFQQLPVVQFGGYALPMHLQTVLLPEDAPALPRIDELATQPWATPPLAEPVSPPLLDGEVTPAPMPAVAALPTSPVFYLREGRVRGQRIAVVAFSPLYQSAAGTQAVMQLQAYLPGAQPLAGLTQLQDRQVVEQRQRRGEEVAIPTNPAAFKPAVKIIVQQAEMQSVGGVELLQAGLSAAMELAQLHLTYNGAEAALAVYDDDGLLDPTTEMRFFAPSPTHSMKVGDRWNATETYWLTVEATPGLRMVSRPVAPGDALRRDSAYAQGIWENNQIYESTMAGIDGDHWFAATLRGEPTATATVQDRLTISVSYPLPFLSDNFATSSFTVTGSARTQATNQLRIEVADASETLIWTNSRYYENWQQTLSSPVSASVLNLLLLPGDLYNELRVDKVYWRQPVALNFQAQGAAFTGMDGIGRYHLTALPANGALYDVTEPRHPQILDTAWSTEVEFQDGPAPRSYLVSGPGTLHTPTLVRHTPVTFHSSLGADVIYVAPGPFHDELAPLVAHRQQQGYQVMVVDVQDIYDAWSYGQVDPQAIRSLLRYAVHNWNPAPIAAVLVGDSTLDPHNYLGSGNPNLLPAYLAAVDPWIGEAPCENCFAQLDDADPLAGISDPGFLTDIWLGRFSVQDETQLTTVVNKILRYETGQSVGHWPAFSLYVADNYVQPNGTLDPAGDFAYLQDLNVIGDTSRGLPPLQSPDLPAVRVYYDPRPGGVTEPWREPDAEQARLRVIEEMKKGPQFVVFNGHANHYQWASTVRSLPNPFLFGSNDIFELHNLEWLPIVLEMTCMTAQFVTVSTSGTTIDERFQRHDDGGAVAIWGSAGLTVLYGHEALLRGFHQQLWGASTAPRLGELIEAGYLTLFQQQGCCQETRMVYLLLGDPLTTALVNQQDQLFLPVVQR